jgi:hypothetical protein
MKRAWFAASRALFALVGAGACLMVVGGLTGGASLSDPVFPAGLLLGLTALGAAVVAGGSAHWQAIVTWLGVLAVVTGVVIFGWRIFSDPNLGWDVYPYFLVPAAIVLAGAVGIALGRPRAGTLGGVRTARIQ